MTPTPLAQSMWELRVLFTWLIFDKIIFILTTSYILRLIHYTSPTSTLVPIPSPKQRGRQSMSKSRQRKIKYTRAIHTIPKIKN